MFFNKKISIYLFFALTLFIGFIFQENSSGGAKIDHEYLLKFINDFTLDLEIGLKNFLNNSGSLIHSPVFYLLSSFFLNLTQNLLIVKILYLLISLSLPFLFYLILKQKYNSDNIFIFYLSLIIFFSPYYRSSAIWLLGDNLSLIFFSISILFFLKYDQNKDRKGLLFISVCFLVACSYIRYYYCIFYLYYFYYFLKNLEIKFIINILLFSFFLSIPALIYFYFIITEYNFLNTLNNFGTINYLNSGISILTILLFYLIPFVIDKEFSIFLYYKKKIKILVFSILIFFVIYFIQKFLLPNLIDFSQRGGGVFMKLAKLSKIDVTFTMLFISTVSVLVLDFLFQKDRFSNYFLLLVLILSLPLLTIYQKYLDPLFYLIFFGLIKSTYLSEIINKKKMNFKFIYFYFSSFYLFSLYYYKSI